jgi:hypothetical protein
MTRPAVPPFFPGPVAPRRDWCGADGAWELADRIEARTQQELAGDGRHSVYGVRSNLVAGLPAGRGR